MKSNLLVAVLMFSGLSSMAQFGEKDQRLISSAFGISSSQSNIPGIGSLGITTANLTLSFGKFIRPNVLVNYSIFGSITDVDNPNPPGTSTNTSTFNIGAAYSQTHYTPIGKKLFFGLGGSGSISYSELRSQIGPGLNDNLSQRFTASIGLAPVLSYQLNHRFVAHLSPSTNFLSLDFAHFENENVGGTFNSTGNSISLNTGFWNSPLSNISIGFSYLLNVSN